MRRKLNTAGSGDVKKLLSTANKPVDVNNILLSAGLWGYRRPLTLSALENLLHVDNKAKV